MIHYSNTLDARGFPCGGHQADGPHISSDDWAQVTCRPCIGRAPKEAHQVIAMAHARRSAKEALDKHRAEDPSLPVDEVVVNPGEGETIFAVGGRKADGYRTPDGWVFVDDATATPKTEERETPPQRKDRT